MIHRFVFFNVEFLIFEKFVVEFFNDRIKFLNRIGSIRKRIEKPIFPKKKKILAIMVLLLLTKTCFFLKLITPKQSIFSKKITIMQNINSYNL